jgi:hypothetical protein
MTWAAAQSATICINPSSSPPPPNTPPALALSQLVHTETVIISHLICR